MRYLRFLSVAGAAFALVFTTGLSAAAGDLDATFDGEQQQGKPGHQQGS